MWIIRVIELSAVMNAAQGILVSLLPDESFSLLQCHILGCLFAREGIRAKCFSNGDQPKVGEQSIATCTEEDIGGFEVAVDDLAPVSEGDGLPNLGENPQAFPKQKRLMVEHVRQGPVGGVLADDVWEPFMEPGIQERKDMGMRQFVEQSHR